MTHSWLSRARGVVKCVPVNNLRVHLGVQRAMPPVSIYNFALTGSFAAHSRHSRAFTVCLQSGTQVLDLFLVQVSLGMPDCGN